MTKYVIVGLGTVLFMVADRAPVDPPYNLDWFTIDGGGAMWSTGGEFALGGTLGQADAGPSGMSGGDLSIVGGFWIVPQPTRADADGDGDTDLSDYSEFQGCCSGPNQPPGELCPPGADTDQDNDMDLSDFWELQNCFNGPNQPPACP